MDASFKAKAIVSMGSIGVTSFFPRHNLFSDLWEKECKKLAGGHIKSAGGNYPNTTEVFKV